MSASGPTNLCGGTVVIIHRLIVPLTLAVFALQAIEARAQSALPAPPTGADDPALPLVKSAAPVFEGAGLPGGENCTNGFLPLRQEAEKRGAMVKTASERHAPADEACRLIGSFAQSEVKMIKYVEAHAQQCGIPDQVGAQLRAGHKNTENMLKKVCDAASQQDGNNPGGKDPKWLRIANRAGK
jgi:hypothetical protein